MELPPPGQERRAAGGAASPRKFPSLTEMVTDMIESLRDSVRLLQGLQQELKSCGPGRRSQGERGPTSAPRSSGVPELYDHVFAEKVASSPSPPSPLAEENRHLKKAVRTLQAQLSLEQRRRGALEERFGLLLRVNEQLEQQLRAAGGYRARALELEAAEAEMRRVLQSERPFGDGVESLVRDSLFVPSRKPGRSLLEEMPWAAPEAQRTPLPRPLQRSSSSETVLSSLAGGDVGKSHDGACTPKAQAAKQSAVSRLQELDTHYNKYNALKARYEELLKQCQQQKGDSLSHKAVQIARAPAARAPPPAGAQAVQIARAPPPAGAQAVQIARAPPPAGAGTSPPPPRYKVIFKEIFSCIQKRKQVVKQRGKYRSFPSP